MPIKMGRLKDNQWAMPNTAFLIKYSAIENLYISKRTFILYIIFS